MSGVWQLFIATYVSPGAGYSRLKGFQMQGQMSEGTAEVRRLGAVSRVEWTTIVLFPQNRKPTEVVKTISTRLAVVRFSKFLSSILAVN